MNNDLLNWIGRTLFAMAASIAVQVSAANAEMDPETILEAIDKIPQMDFFVAKGGPNACGLRCDTWIAAEGRIDFETPTRQNAICNSACAYAVLGGARRDIAPGALLGVHSSYFSLKNIGGGTNEQREKWFEDGVNRNARQTARYLSQMGIDEALLKVASKTRFEDLHYLSRSELYDFGVDRREFLESGWKFGFFEPSGYRFAAFTTTVVKSQTPPAQFRRIAFAISCVYSEPDSYLLTRLEYLPNSWTKPSVDVRVGNDPAEISLNANTSFLLSHKHDLIDVRQSKTVIGMVETLLRSPAIIVTELPRQVDASGQSGDGAAPPSRYSLSVNIGGAEQYVAY